MRSARSVRYQDKIKSKHDYRIQKPYLYLMPVRALFSCSSPVKETRRAVSTGTCPDRAQKRRASRSKCRAAKESLWSRPETKVCQNAGWDPDSQRRARRAMQHFEGFIVLLLGRFVCINATTSSRH